MIPDEPSDDIHAEAPLYAAGALDRESASDFEIHLAGCSACRKEVAAFGDALAELAASVPVEPPRSVRNGVLAQIHDEAAASSAPGPAGGRPADAQQAASEIEAEVQPGPRPVTPLTADHGRHRGKRRARWPVLAAAAALAAVVGIGGWVVGTQQQEQQRQQLAQEQDRRADLLGAGDLTVEQIEVEGRSATLLVSPSQDEGLLVSSDLPDPGQDREYQLWLMRDQTLTPDAHFAGGEVSVWLDGAVDDADAVAMSVEPAGGSPAPTTDPLAVVQL